MFSKYELVISMYFLNEKILDFIWKNLLFFKKIFTSVQKCVIIFIVLYFLGGSFMNAMTAEERLTLVKSDVRTELLEKARKDQNWLKLRAIVRGEWDDRIERSARSRIKEFI